MMFTEASVFRGSCWWFLCILWEALREQLNRSCASVDTLEMINLVADLVVVNALEIHNQGSLTFISPISLTHVDANIPRSLTSNFTPS